MAATAITPRLALVVSTARPQGFAPVCLPCGDRHHHSDASLVPVFLGEQVDRQIWTEPVADVGKEELAASSAQLACFWSNIPGDALSGYDLPRQINPDCRTSGPIRPGLRACPPGSRLVVLGCFRSLDGSKIVHLATEALGIYDAAILGQNARSTHRDCRTWRQELGNGLRLFGPDTEDRAIGQKRTPKFALRAK